MTHKIYINLTLPLKLEHINWIQGPLYYLVKISASWSFELTNFVLFSLDNNFSLTKWQSIFICLVLSWNTGLEAKWWAAWLSQYNFIGWTSQLNCWRNCLILISSQVVVAITLYFASALDQATVFYFLLFKEIMLPPMYTQYPAVDLLSDVSSIGACRPRIFFINGFLCFLEDEWQRNGDGREKGDATSRRRWV